MRRQTARCQLCLESARAIGKAALAPSSASRIAPSDRTPSRWSITVRHFLAVRADVLDRRSADGSRNSREALEASQTARHTPRHHRPRLPGPGGDERRRPSSRCASPNVDLHDQPVEAVIGDHQIAAAAEHEQRRSVSPLPVMRAFDIVDRSGRATTIAPPRRRRASSAPRAAPRSGMPRSGSVKARSRASWATSAGALRP